MARYEDLTGKKFGRLTVLEPTEEKTKDGRRIWKCKCDCGNIKFTTCQNLKRGHYFFLILIDLDKFKEIIKR